MRNVVISCLILPILLACQSAKTSKKPIISVTIEPLRYFTEQIAGNRFDVRSIVPTGSSPETYEPTPRQMVELSQSPIYIKVGKIGFERTWMKRLQANAPKMKVVDSSNGIRYIQSNPTIEDPHTWMSCNNARIIAYNIYHALLQQVKSEADKAYFKKRYNALICQIDALDKEIKKEVYHSTYRSFVIYHPTLTYFAHDYGFQQLSIEEEGREPSAGQMEALVRTAKAKKVKTLFIQREFSPRGTIAIRNATHAKAIEINPLDYNWKQQMLHIAHSLN